MTPRAPSLHAKSCTIATGAVAAEVKMKDDDEVTPNKMNSRML